MLFNACSVCNKLTELLYLLYSATYQIIIVTESWLNANMPSSMLDPENMYQIFRCDRSQTVGGGVCILVSNRINAYEVKLHHCTAELEVICIDINAGNERCRIFAVYRAPHSNTLLDITACIERCMYTKGLCIIAGDFNCPYIDWRNFAATGGPHNEFLNYCIMNGFCQLVTEPTRDSHILDILL